jgi:hypothetical protein
MKQITTINLDQAIPGMELAEDLLNPDNIIVLGAGTVLTKNTILFAKKQLGNSKLNIVTNLPEKPNHAKNVTSRNIPVQGEFESNVDKALSMVLHYEEVVEIAEIIKKVHRERMANREAQGH